MARGRGGDGWLNDYSYIPDKQTFRHARANPDFEVFTGPKLLAILWLALVAMWAGALGGTLVSGALWSVWWRVALWIALAIASFWAARRAALAVSGQPIAFYTGWFCFWAMLMGIVAMWGGRLDSGGWAYGIAAGVGFLVTITQGVYEPDDLPTHEAFFGIGMLSGIFAACFACWLYRNHLDPSLQSAALTGTVAGAIFLVPPWAYLLTHIDNQAALTRLAKLFLHRDETVVEAVPVLDRAIALNPVEASLYDLRGLARALAGRSEAAESDWARYRELDPKGFRSNISRGWVALRRGDAEQAISHFEKAVGRQKRDVWGLVGLGQAYLMQDKVKEALAALELIPNRHHDALSLTRLAEAQLRTGNARDAMDSATDAIDEMDSIYGRTFYIRAEAFRMQGRIDEAELDYNRAFHAAEEEGLDELAIAGLDAIGRPLDEDEPEY